MGLWWGMYEPTVSNGNMKQWSIINCELDQDFGWGAYVKLKVFPCWVPHGSISKTGRHEWFGFGEPEDGLIGWTVGAWTLYRFFHRGSFHRIFQCSWTQSEGLRKLALDCWRAWTVLPASTLLIYLALPIGIPRHLFRMLDNLLKYFPHHYFLHFIPVEQNYVANMATTCEFIIRFQSFHGYKSEYPNFWTPNGGKSPTVSLTLWLFNVANSKPSQFLKNGVHHHKINGPSSIAMWKSHHSET